MPLDSDLIDSTPPVEYEAPPEDFLAASIMPLDSSLFGGLVSYDAPEDFLQASILPISGVLS